MPKPKAQPSASAAVVAETESLRPAVGLISDLDASFVRPPRRFLDQALWAFTEGERALWHSVQRPSDSDALAGFLLISLLRDLQREHDKQIAAGRASDLALELATMQLLAQAGDVERYRARALGQMRSLTRAQVAEAQAVAASILQDAADTELVPAEPGEPGN